MLPGDSKMDQVLISWKRLLIFLIGGIFVACLSLFEAGVGHGTYLPASIFFPWATLLLRFSAKISMIGWCLFALIQWPLYSLWIDIFEERKKVIVASAIGHMAAAVASVVSMH
jgi:hypothetical protein